MRGKRKTKGKEKIMGRLKVALAVDHIPWKGGAKNNKFKLREFDVCEKITNKCISRLADKYSDKIDCLVVPYGSLGSKKRWVDKNKPHVLIENHMNWSWSSKVSGVLTIYEENRLESKKLSRLINDNLVAALISKNHGLHSSKEVKGWRGWKQIFLFDRIETNLDLNFGETVITILTEIEFISNSKVAMLINTDDDFVTRAGESLADSIYAYSKHLEQRKGFNFQKEEKETDLEVHLEIEKIAAVEIEPVKKAFFMGMINYIMNLF